MLFYDTKVSTIGGQPTLVDDYSITKYDKADGSSNREAALRNEMLDMQWAALTGDDALRQQFRPGNFESMDQTSIELELYRMGISRVEVESMTTKQRQAKYDELSYDPRWLDISLMSTAADLKKACMNAKKLIAISAIQEIAHDTLNMMVGPGRYRIAQNIMRSMNIAGLKIGKDDIAFLDDAIDTEGTLQSINLGMLVGSAADGVKKPVLARMNIGMYTIKIYTQLLRYGATPRQAMLFVTQPIMRELTEAYDNASNNGFADVQKLIRNIESQIDPNGVLYDMYNSKDSIRKYTLELPEDELIDRLINDKNFDAASYIDNSDSEIARTDMKILAALRTLDVAVNGIEGINQFSRFTSIVNGESPSLAKSIEKESRREKFLIDQSGNKPMFNTIAVDENGNMIKDSSEALKISRIESEIPFIGERIDAQQSLHKALMQVLPSYNSDVFRAATDIVAKLCGRDYANESINKSVHKAMSLYKFSNGVRIKTYGDSSDRFINGVFDPTKQSDVDLFYKNFVSYYNDVVSKYSDELEGNSFIEAISEFNADNIMPVPYLKTSLSQLDDDGRQKIMDDWSALIRGGNKDLVELGLNLGIYFAIRSNMRYSPNTPYHLMPVDVISAMPRLDALDRMEAASDPQIDLNDFIGLYILNNSNQPGLVPAVNLEYLAQSDAVFGDSVIMFDANNQNLDNGNTGYNPVSNIGRFYIQSFDTENLTDRQRQLFKAIGFEVRRDEMRVNRPIVKSGDNLIMLTDDSLAFKAYGFEVPSDGHIIFRAITPKGIPNGMAEYFGDMLDDGVYGNFNGEADTTIEQDPNDMIIDESGVAYEGLNYIPNMAQPTSESMSGPLDGTAELSLSALGISEAQLDQTFVGQRKDKGLNRNLSDDELLKKFGFNTSDSIVTTRGRQKIADLLREKLDDLNLC